MSLLRRERRKLKCGKWTPKQRELYNRWDSADVLLNQDVGPQLGIVDNHLATTYISNVAGKRAAETNECDEMEQRWDRLFCFGEVISASYFEQAFTTSRIERPV